MKKYRVVNIRLSSQNEIIDFNLLTPSPNSSSNVVNINCDSGISNNSILKVRNTSIIHSSPKIKINIRKRIVFCLPSSFESVYLNTQKITT